MARRKSLGDARPAYQAGKPGKYEQPGAVPRRAQRFTVNLDAGQVEEVRAAVVALSGPPHLLTLSSFTAEAFRRELDRLQKTANRGRPFPPLAGRRLRRGRPIGS